MAKTSKKSDKSVAGLDFLLDPAAHEPHGLCLVAGSEAFLKREVLGAMRRQVGGGDADFAWSAFEGDRAEWRDVADAISSMSLFGGGPPAALVEDADKFVSTYRDALEKFAERPGRGVLVLELSKSIGNTRLGKMAAEHGLVIRCSAPDRGAELTAFVRSAKKWLSQRAIKEHGAKIAPSALDAVFERLPTSLGVLDQEIARLALLAASDGGGKPVIDDALVEEHVGGWRVRTAWEMIDAVADGRAADALRQLDRLLMAGEQPIGVFAQLSSTLRKFADATAVIERAEREGRRPNLREAVEGASFPRFKTADAERQLRQIGRVRAKQLHRRLLESDLALKGHNSPPARARIELERLVVSLSSHAAPSRPS
ncbi:DNA polymerase III subunit delta [Pseudobythopirellula maris]|uniref:DNA-directed DNA polymerase n=1 Tax=Pseudobythopirellula maris TaxID=2527991 RepID=A0A5C5ZL80_9BACT|nr:DNA polymerase III subunit delta [Pseudobythopirellula maris]TWT87737.1 DNA polymerase III subunit delta [Pseudobythopirellula maris]